MAEYRKKLAGQSVWPEALWRGHLYRSEIEHGDAYPLEIEWVSQQKGYGAFSREPLEPLTYIGIYAGCIRPCRWFDKRVNGYCFRMPTYGKGPIQFVIDAKHHGSLTRFLNHSDTPNCEALSSFYEGLPYIVIRTIVSIEAGEELCFNYGPEYSRILSCTI